MKIVFGELFISNLKNFNGRCGSFISSEYVVDLDAVEFAARKAIENWESGRRISKSLSLEILLYYAATRQIKDAVKLGVKEGVNRVAAVVLDESEFESLDFKEVEFEPEFDLRKIVDHYEITDEEFQIVGKEKLSMLIRERIALFAALRE
jgi:KEOPS complex subunit Cgi121